MDLLIYQACDDKQEFHLCTLQKQSCMLHAKVCDFFATMFTPKFLQIYVFIIEPGNAIRLVLFSFFFSVTSKPQPVIIRSLHATCEQHPCQRALLRSNMAEAAGLEATEVLSCVRGYHVYCKIWTPYTVKKEVLL